MTVPVEHPSLPAVIRSAIAAYNNHDAEVIDAGSLLAAVQPDGHRRPGGRIPMRKLTIAPLIVTASIALTTGLASAHPGHTSCRDFGQHNASEAHDQMIDEEVRFFGPGNVDDVIALVHLGGTFDGEPVPALCEAR